METALLPFIVLNAGGRDPDQDFPDFAGEPGTAAHAPVNYHAYAASTRGAFVRSVDAVRSRQGKTVLLLLRSDLPESLKVLRQLRVSGCEVFISFKESGLHQIAPVLQKKGNAAALQTLCSEATGALSSTPDAVAIYQAAGAKNVHFLPTPYPVDDPRWDFSIPVEQRRGIFIGTREFDVPSRNHLPAVLAALHLGRTSGEPVSVVNLDGRSGRQQLTTLAAAVGGSVLEIIEGRRNYLEYLRLVAKHRLVFQFDASAVPGQIAGDALLCRIPCVGGNGATERVAFPHLNSHGRDLAEISDLAKNLLQKVSYYEEAVAKSQELASSGLSFGSVAGTIAQLANE